MKYWLILFILISYNAHSEPSPISKYLMNEPVSMMDMGVYRLENRLREVKLCRGSKVFAGYVWEKDSIDVWCDFHVDLEMVEAMKRVCHDEIKRMNIYVSGFSLNLMFSHNGYTTKSRPDDFNERIKSLVNMQVTVFGKDKTVVCVSSAADEEIYYREEDSSE